MGRRQPPEKDNAEQNVTGNPNNLPLKLTHRQNPVANVLELTVKV